MTVYVSIYLSILDIEILFIYLFQDKLFFFFLVYIFLHKYVEGYWVVHLVLGNMDYIWDPTDHWEN